MIARWWREGARRALPLDVRTTIRCHSRHVDRVGIVPGAQQRGGWGGVCPRGAELALSGADLAAGGLHPGGGLTRGDGACHNRGVAGPQSSGG